MEMPELTGLQVIEKIKEQNLEKEPKFVLVTGERDRETLIKAYDLEVSKIIYKPFINEQILEALDEVIDEIERN